MELVIAIMKGYFVVTVIVMICYAIRHYIFSYNRMFYKQKVSYRDIYDSEYPKIAVLIPMHNEELVVENVLESLLKCDYDRDKMEIIPINDHSDDKTGEILDKYSEKYNFVKVLHRNEPDQLRGKPVGLNEAMELTDAEIIIVFDADYRPSVNMLKKLATAFKDPQVGAVMGRVIPINANANKLTTLLNLERTGGYQVDQQARYNLGLIPQYGGTVGGFRKELLLENGGFDTKILAEDTELTYRMYLKGYTVVYDNSAECYEEAPETWTVRGKQIRRWSRGHNEVMFKYFWKFLFCNNISILQKIDGIMLLFIYFVPVLLFIALFDSVGLFFLGEMNIVGTWMAFIALGFYNAWGNFAPFYEISAGAILDGLKKEVYALPLLSFSFYFYMWYIMRGFFDALIDVFTSRNVTWAKTKRFKNKEGEAK
ncbi:MAG: glycosyltransferase [Lachnospiraceae bacterium]|nr:glycosyltransferase [Lachnospiraceae bacterium]